MRIDQLNLSRYGHFTDFVIDFGKLDNNSSDLHIIYGPNEAGKSTTLSAVIDLLYGMPAQSRYAFIHDYQTLAIIAKVEQNRHPIELHRFKNKLLAENGQPLPANAIDVHGLNREDFKSRFSFDEETLKEGGESILQNNGDLGAALFAATSGIADFSQALSKLTQTANAFYEPTKKKDKVLYILKDELKLIDEKLKQLDINASAWSKKVEQSNTLKDRFDEFKNKARANQLNLETLKTKQQALATAKRIQSVQSAINALPTMPSAPETWLATARELNKQQYSLNAQNEHYTKQIIELKKHESSIGVDTKLSALSESIEKLRTNKTLYEKRSEDLNELTENINDLTNQQRQWLSQMGIKDSNDASHYILPESLSEQLTALQATHDQIISTLSAAEKEFNATKNELKALDFNKDTKTLNIDALNNCISIAQDNALAARFKQLQEQLIDTQSQLEENLSALNPWRGDTQQLLEQKLPSKAYIQKLQTQITQINNDIAVSESGIEISLEERSSLQTNDATKTKLASDTLESGRNNRNKLIQVHLKQLDDELPHAQLHKSAREIALQQQQLDQLTDQQIAIALQQGQSEATQSRFLALSENAKHLQAQLTAQKQQQDKLNTELSEFASSLQLYKDASAQDILNWLGLREVAVSNAHRLNKLEIEAAQISDDMHSESNRLKALMLAANNSNDAAINDMIDSAEILGLAQAIANKQKNVNAALQQAQDNHAALNKKLEIRQADLESAKLERKQWQDSWGALLQTTWIESTDPTQVSTILKSLSHISALQTQLDTNKRQLHTLNTEQDTYQKRAAEAIGSLEISTEISFAEQLNILFNKHAANIEINVTLKKLAEQILTAKSDQETTQNALLPIAKQLGEMCDHCKVKNSTELEQQLEQLREKDKKLSELQGFEQELQSLLNVSSIDEAMSSLSDVNEHELPALISEQELTVHSDTNTLNDLHHEYRTVQDPIDRFHVDTNVAQLKQKRQSLLLEIEDQAMQTMRTRLGKLALEQGVRHFRDKHRSSMLENAKKAFTTITCGNYIDLKTQPGKQGNNEDLVGIRDTGQSKLASNMSSGTRAQLYLALRIAAYEDYCKTRAPLPFIADDIMETFDENRTEATLSLLSNMGQHGQIMYLTHHRHVVDIARNILGKNVRVHELPANPLREKATSDEH